MDVDLKITWSQNVPRHLKTTNLFPLSSHICIRTEPFCFAVTWCPSATSMNLSVSSNDPGIKSVTSGVIWHFAPESKIQLFNFKLLPYFPLLCSSSLDIYAIYAYILWSSSSSLLLHARLTFSLERAELRLFSSSFGGLGHFAIMWSSDQHLKHFHKFLFDETSTARAFYFPCIILLRHFSAE